MASPLDQPVPFINVPLWQLLLIGAIVVIVYLILTRKPKVKEFKPLDFKKELKKDTKKEFKYFGDKAGVLIYDKGEIEHAQRFNKKPHPFGYVVAIMKVVWNEQYKKYVPLYKSSSKDPRQAEKMEMMSKEIYNKSFKDLDEPHRKDIREATIEELRDEYVEIKEVGKKLKIVRGKQEIPYNVPVGTYCLKISAPNLLSRLVAQYFGVGIDFFRFNADQLNIENDRITLTANFQRHIYNDQFVFSMAGLKTIDDISLVKDREQHLQAIANETSKVQFFDTGMARDIERLREAYRLESEKHKVQTESHEMR